MQVYGTGLGLESEACLAAARRASRVFCPVGLPLGQTLREEGVPVREALPDRAQAGDVYLLWGGPEPGDPWLRWAVAAGAQIRYGAPLPVLLELPEATRSRHAEEDGPWPAAQAVVVYGPGGRVPDALWDAPPGVLFSRGGRKEGPVPELFAQRGPDGLLYAPPLGDGSALAFAGAKSVMGRLRGPTGCPWDREQTHRSLLPYLLEEAAEVYDALLAQQTHEIVEELGDLLLQVLFHAQLGQERGEFDAGEVADGLRQKLRRRHPHVFGTEHYATADEFLPRWEELKREEGTGRSSELDGIPAALSSLGALQKGIRRLQRAGVEQVAETGYAALFARRIADGEDLEAAVRGELQELRKKCRRAEEILGCKLSDAGEDAVKTAWERAKLA